MLQCYKDDRFETVKSIAFKPHRATSVVQNWQTTAAVRMSTPLCYVCLRRMLGGGALPSQTDLILFSWVPSNATDIMAAVPQHILHRIALGSACMQDTAVFRVTDRVVADFFVALRLVVVDLRN